MNTKLTQSDLTSADPVHAAYIAKLKQNIVGRAELEGRQHGCQNKPGTEAEYRALVVNYIQSAVQEGLDINQERYLPISGMVVARTVQADAHTQLHGLQAEYAHHEHVLTALETESCHVKPNLRHIRARGLAMVGMTLIALADGWLSFQGFRFASFPVLAAISASVGVAAGIGLGAQYLAGFIKRAKDRVEFIVRYGLSLVPYMIGFYALGRLRADAYNYVSNLAVGGEQAAATSSTAVSAWSIALVSFLLFWLALFLAIRFYISKAERKQEQDYRDACEETGKVRHAMRMNQEKVAAIKRDAATKSELALARYEHALACENRLISLARLAEETYKSANIRFRTDGCPAFFSIPTQFQFNRFFNTAKPQQQ